MKKYLSSSFTTESQAGELYKLTFPEGIEDSFRFFNHDVGLQTEESDMLQLLELTEALSKLTIENNILHRDMNLIRSTLQTEFHRRLTNASDQLYSRMNQRLDEVERSQRDRVEVVRRAFRTQLSDALSQMASLYNQKLRDKLINNRTFVESEESIKHSKKIAELVLKLKKSEVKIKELTKQISELEDNYAEELLIMGNESDTGNKLETKSEEEIREATEQSMKDDIIQELNERIKDLIKINDSYQKTVKNLQFDIKNMTSELFSMKEMTDIVKMEKQRLKEKVENLEDKNSKYQSETQNLTITKPILPLSKPILDKPVTVSFDVQKNFKDFPDLSNEVLSLKEIIKNFHLRESESLKEFSKLKSTLVIENKSYMEEIKVLQTINIKLKEEMFNRIEIQNKFKNLHSASVTYAKNSQSIGILPNQYSELQDSKLKNKMNIISTFRDKSQLIEKDKEILQNFVDLGI